MKLTDIRNLINSRLAGEQLTYSALLPYLDAVVDEINAKLHAKFKTFSEISTTGIPESGKTFIDYNEFPDKYIRTVVCVGAAWHWYVDDEEGIDTAISLKQQYDNGLFIMLRDYGPLVPEDKQVTEDTGFIKGRQYLESPAINPETRYIPVAGYPGTSVEALELRQHDNEQHLWAKLVSYTEQGLGYKWIDCGALSDPNLMHSINTRLGAGKYLNQIGVEITDK